MIEKEQEQDLRYREEYSASVVLSWCTLLHSSTQGGL